MPKSMSAAVGAVIAVTTAITWLASAQAQNLPPWHHPPFTSTLSNNTPLAFGMDAPAAARALGTSLNYLSGLPGNEVLVAIRTVGGSELFDRRDRLYLQFRRGQLTGWKGDWGSHWMWQ